MFVFNGNWLSLLHNIAGVKLSDASKKLGKKFATGASVVKVCQSDFTKSSGFIFL